MPRESMPEDDAICAEDKTWLEEAIRLSRLVLTRLTMAEEWTNGTLDDTPYINRENMVEDISRAQEFTEKLCDVISIWNDGNPPEWNNGGLTSYVSAEDMPVFKKRPH